MKQVILNFLSDKLPGYHVWVFRRRQEPQGEYLAPRFVFSPWKKHLLLLSKVKPYTVVSKTRLFELYDLVGQATKRKGDIIEVGTYRGGSGATIARSIIDHGAESKLYLCDTFEGVVKSTQVDTYFSNGEFKASENDVQNALNAVDASEVQYEIISGIFPDESAKLIPESALFCFCHIDVDVYLSAKDILNWVWPKMVSGGIVVFDDYGSITCPGIQRLVSEFCSEKDCICIYNLNGHAILIKV